MTPKSTEDFKTVDFYLKGSIFQKVQHILSKSIHCTYLFEVWIVCINPVA